MKQHVLLRVLSAEADRDALRPILDALKEKAYSAQKPTETPCGRFLTP